MGFNAQHNFYNFDSQISDGQTGSEIAKLCDRLGPTVVTTASSFVRVFFHTDSSVTYKGWNFTWSGKDKMVQHQKLFNQTACFFGMLHQFVYLVVQCIREKI